MPTYRRRQRKIGRNEKCPCGSGIKFKYCCLRPGVQVIRYRVLTRMNEFCKNLFKK